MLRLGAPLASLLLIITFTNLPAFSFSKESDSSSTFVVNRIILEGNKHTKPFVIMRELPFEEGDTVTSDELDYTRERIYSTGLFTKVLTTPELISRDTANVIISVEESWHIWPFPVLGFRDREISLKRLYGGLGVLDFNFRGMAERLEGMFVLGYDPFALITYSSPSIGKNRDYLIGLGASYSHGANIGLQSTYSSGQFDDSFGDFYIVAGKRMDLFSVVSLGAAYNYVAKITNDSNSFALSLNGKDVFASVWAEYSYDSRDLRIYASRGIYLDFVIEKYGLGESVVNFGRFSFDMRQYLPVWDFLSLAGRMHGSLAEGPSIPRYDDVFFGLGERIRGMFNTQSEGQSIMGGNFEIRIPVIKRMYVEMPWFSIKEFMSNRIALYWNFFADAGETSDKFLNMGWDRLLYGYGGGMSLLLPYDFSVEVDFARGRDGHFEWIFDFGETI